jgi:septal ring factor EnvC (AmiA/AmiB activator)
MEEIAMLKATIQDLSDARKQMLQQQDDNKQLQQEINKLQEKNRQQKNLIQGLQPAKLQRLRQQLKQMKNKLQASKRMLRQHVAVQEHLTAEKRRATAERLKLLKANKNSEGKLKILRSKSKASLRSLTMYIVLRKGVCTLSR